MERNHAEGPGINKGVGGWAGTALGHAIIHGQVNYWTLREDCNRLDPIFRDRIFIPFKCEVTNHNAWFELEICSTRLVCYRH